MSDVSDELPRWNIVQMSKTPLATRLPERFQSPNGVQGAKRAMIQRYRNTLKAQSGKIGYILAWVLGVPIPILIVVYLLRGCT